MSLGPVELLVVEFPGNQFKGEIVPALKELVEKQMIRIVDFVFVRKEADGTVPSMELNQLDDGEYATFDPIVADVTGLLSDDDIRQLGELLDDNSSAGLMLFENVWAKRFADAGVVQCEIVNLVETEVLVETDRPLHVADTNVDVEKLLQHVRIPPE